MRRWALVGAAVTGGALAALVGLVVLLSGSACATLTLEADPAAPGAVALDEARVRGEAPQLAALLDRAVDEGRATETHERSARAMAAYLDGRDVVAWRGTPVRVALAAC